MLVCLGYDRAGDHAAGQGVCGEAGEGDRSYHGPGGAGGRGRQQRARLPVDVGISVEKVKMGKASI